jgi:hypothetical protein
MEEAAVVYMIAAWRQSALAVRIVETASQPTRDVTLYVRGVVVMPDSQIGFPLTAMPGREPIQRKPTG